MKPVLFCILCALNSTAFAQWAVYDHRVHEEIRKINAVQSTGSPSLNNFEDQAELSADFSTIELVDRARFVMTQEDCGDRDLNQSHYLACQGLRNLRLKTLEQSEGVLRVIQQRRTQITDLIRDARGVTEAGRLQRHQFELQGLQAQIQNDALQLQVLMDGYKQREKMYEMQMAEARRVSDTRRPGAMSLGAVPFVPALMR